MSNFHFVMYMYIHVPKSLLIHFLWVDIFNRRAKEATKKVFHEGVRDTFLDANKQKLQAISFEHNVPLKQIKVSTHIHVHVHVSFSIPFPNINFKTTL